MDKKISFIGVGPGDPDLLTLKALEKIENDPTVKQAIKVFDGTLDPESVSPIED